MTHKMLQKIRMFRLHQTPLFRIRNDLMTWRNSSAFSAQTYGSNTQDTKATAETCVKQQALCTHEISVRLSFHSAKYVASGRLQQFTWYLQTQKPKLCYTRIRSETDQFSLHLLSRNTWEDVYFESHKGLRCCVSWRANSQVWELRNVQ